MLYTETEHKITNAISKTFWKTHEAGNVQNISDPPSLTPNSPVSELSTLYLISLSLPDS